MLLGKCHTPNRSSPDSCDVTNNGAIGNSDAKAATAKPRLTSFRPSIAIASVPLRNMARKSSLSAKNKPFLEITLSTQATTHADPPDSSNGASGNCRASTGAKRKPSRREIANVVVAAPPKCASIRCRKMVVLPMPVPPWSQSFRVANKRSGIRSLLTISPSGVVSGNGRNGARFVADKLFRWPST